MATGAAKQRSSPVTLPGVIDQLERHGDRHAVLHFAREDCSTWTFTRLCREARTRAAALQASGLKRGDKVAVLADPSPAWFGAALGVLRAGGVLVPIDTQMSAENLARVISDSEPRQIFTTSRLARRLQELDNGSELDLVLLDEEADQAEPLEAGSIDQAITEDDEAVLFYTSGTTGPPKGVPLTHRNILFQIHSIEQAGLVHESDRMLQPLPLHHVYPLVIGLLTPLTLGVAILIPHALTGEEITRALREGKASIILGVPRLYEALFKGIRAKLEGGGRIAVALFDAALALSRGARRAGIPLGRLLFLPIRSKMGPDVRMLASGGSPLDAQLAQNLEALGWPVAVGYGLTETSPLLTLKRPGEGSFESVGRPIEGVELKIDPEGLPEDEGKRQPAGKSDHERGEVLARGPSVFSGYHKLPEKTEESFSDDWFRTGDLGYLKGGFLFLSGRASAMIVLQGGENVDPEELERIYGEVDEVAGIGILEDDGKLAALVVPERSALRQHSGEELAQAISQALKQSGSGLSSYQQLSRIEITRQELPTTNLGKIKRHLLKDRYEAARKGEDEEPKDGGPVDIDALSGDDRTLLEDARAKRLWDYLARRYKDRRLTPDASLEFDLGIDSLEWVELSMYAEEQAGISIDEDMINEVETVRDLLEKAASAEGNQDAQGRRPIEEPEAVLQPADMRWAAPRGPFASAAGWIIYRLLSAMLSLRCRLEVRGLEQLPAQGPYIIVANHTSYLDAPALAVALGYQRCRQQFWAGHGDILFRNIVRRWFSRIAQIIPIDPRHGPISSLAVSALLVKRGHPLVWFPEGRVSRDGSLQKFQPGIGLIIDHYEPPVIPVHISGTHEALPPDARFPGSGSITVTIGEAVVADDLKTEAEAIEEGEIHSRIAHVLQQKVAALSNGQSQQQ